MDQDRQLSSSAPEAQGVPSSAILNFVEAAEAQIEYLHGMVLLRHGHLIARGWWSPYRADRPHMLFSLSKSFTSTAVGLAVADRLLSVDDPVLSFFPEEAPSRISRNLAAMQVRHLLSMSTGHAEDTLPRLFRRKDRNWAKAFLSRPVKYAPGTHFLYNSGASYMLSAIVQKVTGSTLLDYLTPRIFGPLGITNPTWETSPQGVNTGGWGLSVKTEDIARFGQLYLQKGLWHGRRLLPEAWIDEATRSHIDNGPNVSPEWEQGYGYQFWRCRHGAYRGDGAFGQFCIVMPEQDAVLAITSGVSNMQAVLDLVWEHLLPAMGSDALPADPQTAATLGHKLDSLTLPPQAGATHSPVAAVISGRDFTFDANDLGWTGIAFAFDAQGCEIRIRSAKGDYRMRCGHGTWIEGTVPAEDGNIVPAAVSAAWTGEDSYTVSICLVETPFIHTMKCTFAEGAVTIQYRTNVSFGPVEGPTLVARLV